MFSVLATSEFLLNNGINLALVLGALGLVVAGWLINRIKRAPAGNERMQEVAGAIQEGAKAYLKRQLVAVGIIAAVIFVLLLIGFHVWCLLQMRLFAVGRNTHSERYFRALNEMPVFALFAIVILVVVKPF